MMTRRAFAVSALAASHEAIPCNLNLTFAKALRGLTGREGPHGCGMVIVRSEAYRRYTVSLSTSPLSL
jgi:hypothetical protein